MFLDSEITTFRYKNTTLANLTEFCLSSPSFPIPAKFCPLGKTPGENGSPPRPRVLREISSFENPCMPLIKLNKFFCCISQFSSVPKSVPCSFVAQLQHPRKLWLFKILIEAKIKFIFRVFFVDKILFHKTNFKFHVSVAFL